MNKKNNKGCFSGILGTIFVVLGVAAYAVISSLFNRAFVGEAFGNEIACGLMTKWLTGVGIAFILYEAIFILWEFDLLKKTKSNFDEKNGKRILLAVALICICASLLVGVVFANTYIECREDSISKVCFAPTKEYRWDTRCDVLRYSLSCDQNGSLTFNITMKDGEVVELLGNVTSVSESFNNKYSTDKVNLLSYAAYLSEEFESSEFIIEKSISGKEYMEKFYNNSERAEIWACIERILIE